MTKRLEPEYRQQPTLEEAQATIMALPPKAREQLRAWVTSSIGVPPAAGFAKGHSGVTLVGESLHAIIRNTVGCFGNNVASLGTLKRLKPAMVKNLELHAKLYEESLHTLFPGCTRVQMEGVRVFLVHCAAGRLNERGRQVTFQGVLDALIPLEELVDDCFPGYRASGVLKETLLHCLNRDKKGGQ